MFDFSSGGGRKRLSEEERIARDEAKLRQRKAKKAAKDAADDPRLAPLGLAVAAVNKAGQKIALGNSDGNQSFGHRRSQIALALARLDAEEAYLSAVEGLLPDLRSSLKAANDGLALRLVDGEDVTPEMAADAAREIFDGLDPEIGDLRDTANRTWCEWKGIDPDNPGQPLPF